jgi:two-component system chemotaxis response regulator CheY
MPQETLEQATSNLRVLVVDDNAALRGLLRVSLQAFGCRKVIEASSPDAAMDSLRTEQIDLIITDWKMSPRDGIDFVRELRDPQRSPTPYLPVIMLTAYSDAGRIRQARAVGVDEFLIKPFTADALARRVRDVLTDQHDLVTAGDGSSPDCRDIPQHPVASVAFQHAASS